MHWPEVKLIQASIQTEWPQVATLLILVLVFSANVAGLIQFGSDSFPGVSFNSEAFLANDVLLIPEVVSTPEFLILLSSGLILAGLMPLLTPIAASILVALFTVPPLYMSLGMQYRESLIPMEYSLLVLLVLFGMNVLLKYFAETQKKQKLINDFGRFVPPEIVDQLSKQPGLLELEGTSKEMTVFFCDLKNFTGFSEQLNPKELVSLLNEYFTLMTEILYKHGATIDKYIGDSIMAFWSAPIPQEDHARRAVMASIEMHQGIEKLSKDFISRGWPGPTMGVGINSGEMNVGNMGSRYRLAYTVIGDAVNLAARVEAMTRIYGVPTIVGEKTARAIDDMVFKELDTVVVKGKTSSSKIYQPICFKDDLSEEQSKFLQRHDEALKSYYARDLEKAKQLFVDLQSQSEYKDYYTFMIEKLSDRRRAQIPF